VVPGLLLSVAIGLAVTWLGLALAYFYDRPIGFYVTTVAFGAYLLANAGRWILHATRARLATP
jgi:zinc/manganese transport system permease protein